MDALHSAGVLFAAALQSGPPWLGRFWLWVTALADPRCIFTLCFPLAYFLDRQVGVSVLWVGLLAEWLNVVLKWFLFGERPFWWVHESGLAGKGLLRLRQFPASCETGPGSPSGHCMITGAALWPLVTALRALAARRCRSRVVTLIPLATYTLLLLAVGLSRVFILAHFPHQVVSGILAGEWGWGQRSVPPTQGVLGTFPFPLNPPLFLLVPHNLPVPTTQGQPWAGGCRPTPRLPTPRVSLPRRRWPCCSAPWPCTAWPWPPASTSTGPSIWPPNGARTPPGSAATPGPSPPSAATPAAPWGWGCWPASPCPGGSGWAPASVWPVPC